MTNEELKNEFSRWLDNGKGEIWYKTIDTREWLLVVTKWCSTGSYITNDKHQELRKLQIDESATKFEIRHPSGSWHERIPSWDINREYRVMVEPVYEWQYLYPVDKNNYALTVHREKGDFEGYERLEKSKRIKND